MTAITPRLLRASAVVLLAALAIARPAPAQTVSGVGSRDCTAFAFALEKDSDEALDAYVSWSQGFISGFNWANVRGRDVRVDPAGLIHWLAEYCAANPRARIDAAVRELVRIHAR